jgi:3-oxoacyl-[acyl-carrier protein] reductase
MRRVVVTGGGTGIGLAVAGEFVRAGDSVTITGRREHVLKEAAGRFAAAAGRSGGAVGYVCFDASDPASVSAALELLPARVDVLVNNAGRTPHRAGHPRQRRRLPGAVSWPGR